MAPRYSVMLGWHSSAMREVAQTGFYDANASTLQRMAREADTASPFRLVFDFSAPGVPPVHEWMQVWAGWREGNAWLQGPDPPFLGFLVQLEGGGNAVHEIKGQIQTMQYLMSRATVIGWPTHEDGGFVQDGEGYPPDYSVTNWLVGTSPYPGVIRQYFPNALYDGIDPYFDTLTLDATCIPGGNTEGIVGHWGWTTVDAIVQDMIGVARYRAAQDGLLIEPVSWWRTVAQGSILRPQFRLIDTNDTASKPVKAVFSVDPQPGEFYMKDFHHTRDGKDVRTDVVVVGIGGDPATQIRFHTRFNDHNTDYPCEYLPQGIGGEPYFDTSIGDQATADRVAAAIGYRVWGALGALNWQTDGMAVGGLALTYFEPGDVIALYDPAEGQNYTRYVVRKVTPDGGTAGHPTYRIEVGDVIPNVKDLIRGATIVQPHRRAIGTGSGTNTRGASLGVNGLPGAPPQIPVEYTPTHNQGQNTIRPGFKDVHGLTFRPGTQLRAGQDETTPGGLQTQHYNAADVRTQWTDHDGVHHPIGVVMQWSADGTKYFVPWADVVGVDVAGTEYSGTGSETFAFTVNGTPVTPPFNASKGARIGVTAAGVDAGTPLTATVREQDQAVVVIV